MKFTGQLGFRMRLIRKILFIGLTALWLMNLTGYGFAQPPEIVDEAHKDPAPDNVPLMKPVVEMKGEPEGIIFHHWQGFALKGNESYALRISIESVRPVEPVSVRKILASNMTIEEVSKKILAQEGNITYRGHIMLQESAYQLANIKMTFAKNNLTLNADVIESQNGSSPGNATMILGRLTVDTSSQEGVKKGQGELIVNEGLDNKGIYQVLLDMLH
jgi:hypothetical protein